MLPLVPVCVSFAYLGRLAYKCFDGDLWVDGRTKRLLGNGGKTITIDGGLDNYLETHGIDHDLGRYDRLIHTNYETNAERVSYSPG